MSGRSAVGLSDSDPLPLYAQLAGLLRQRIGRGEWQQGDRLPSLEQLTQEFAVARVTVRQAVALLQADGLVQARQGRGTFVTGRAGLERPMRVQTNLRELVVMLQNEATGVLNLSEGQSIPALELADGEAATQYVALRRVHLRRDVPYCVIAIWLDRRIFRRAATRFRRETIIPILMALPGLHITHAHQTLLIGAADAEAAGHLGVAVGAPVAHVRRVFRAADGTVAYLGEVTYRGDLVQLEMDLVP